MTGYTHPATARRNELIREGWTVIATDVALDAAKKHPVGSVWISTGEVLAPPPKSQKQKDAA